MRIGEEKKSVKEVKSGGISFCGLLAIVFIALKLLDKIDWSWWWVLSPIWIPPVLGIALFGIILLGAIVFDCVSR